MGTVYVKPYRKKEGQLVKGHSRHVSASARAKRYEQVRQRVASRMARGASTSRFAQLSRLHSSLAFEVKSNKGLTRAVRGKVNRPGAYYQYRRNFGMM